MEHITWNMIHFPHLLLMPLIIKITLMYFINLYQSEIILSPICKITNHSHPEVLEGFAHNPSHMFREPQHDPVNQFYLNIIFRRINQIRFYSIHY